MDHFGLARIELRSAAASRENLSAVGEHPGVLYKRDTQGYFVCVQLTNCTEIIANDERKIAVPKPTVPGGAKN
jgi:hypothetical protein